MPGINIWRNLRERGVEMFVPLTGDYRPILVVGPLTESIRTTLLNLADTNNGRGSQKVIFSSWEDLAKRIQRNWEKNGTTNSAQKYKVVIVTKPPQDWKQWYASTGLFLAPPKKDVVPLFRKNKRSPQSNAGTAMARAVTRAFENKRARHGDRKLHETLNTALRTGQPERALEAWCSLGTTNLVYLPNGHKIEEIL